jgi:prevent-host-death family protein
MAEVGITQLRRELEEWLARARAGDEVVITERGRPVARLSGIDVAPLLDRLTEEGRIRAAPAVPRPSVSGRRRIEARRAGFRTRHAARTALTSPHDGQRPTRLRAEPLVDVQVPPT